MCMGSRSPSDLDERLIVLSSLSWGLKSVLCISFNSQIGQVCLHSILFLYQRYYLLSQSYPNRTVLCLPLAPPTSTRLDSSSSLSSFLVHTRLHKLQESCTLPPKSIEQPPISESGLVFKLNASMSLISSSMPLPTCGHHVGKFLLPRPFHW